MSIHNIDSQEEADFYTQQEPEPPSMKNPQPKDWQERFEDKFCVMLERYISDYPTKQGEEMIDEVYSFITYAIKDAIEAERARIESLIPENETVVYANGDLRELADYHEKLGFRKAILIIKKAVKRV
jgi:hypothetical protein